MALSGCHTQPWGRTGHDCLISQGWDISHLLVSAGLGHSCHTTTYFLCWTASRVGMSVAPGGAQVTPYTCSNCPRTTESPSLASPPWSCKLVRTTWVPSVQARPWIGGIAWYNAFSPVLRSFPCPNSILSDKVSLK